jgi:hypothetical protein
MNGINAGLDQLTQTFSFAVGPAGFGKISVGLLISTAAILIGRCASYALVIVN